MSGLLSWILGAVYSCGHFMLCLAGTVVTSAAKQDVQIVLFNVIPGTLLKQERFTELVKCYLSRF